MSWRLPISLSVAAFTILALAEPTNSYAATGNYPAFESQLTSSQDQQFQALPSSQQNEMVAIFSDVGLMDGQTDDAQAQAEYPGLQISNEVLVAFPVSTTQGVSAAPMATTYNVHSWYKHTDTFLFLSNTATLDYYYVTGSNKVLSEQRCTWHDAGPTLQSINNITTNMWLSSGNGHCYADVELSSIPYGIINNYLDQDMDVNYHGIYHTHFYESDN